MFKLKFLSEKMFLFRLVEELENKLKTVDNQLERLIKKSADEKIVNLKDELLSKVLIYFS